MFRRLLFIGHQNARLNLFGESIRRHFHKDDRDNFVLVPGGGLEKLQGGIREEKYFNDHDLELLAKMRADGSKKLKCENSDGNWTEFKKVLNASTEQTALRETCSLNKNRNCMEEAYFMNEQTENLRQLKGKCPEDDKKDFNILHANGNEETPTH